MLTKLGLALIGMALVTVTFFVLAPTDLSLVTKIALTTPSVMVGTGLMFPLLKG